MQLEQYESPVRILTLRISKEPNPVRNYVHFSTQCFRNYIAINCHRHKCHTLRNHGVRSIFSEEYSKCKTTHANRKRSGCFYSHGDFTTINWDIYCIIYIYDIYIWYTYIYMIYIYMIYIYIYDIYVHMIYMIYKYIYTYDIYDIYIYIWYIYMIYIYIYDIYIHMIYMIYIYPLIAQSAPSKSSKIIHLVTWPSLFFGARARSNSRLPHRCPRW